MAAEMNLIPQADYLDACDAIREKDGSTALIKSGELGAKIRTLGSNDLEKRIDGSITEVHSNATEVSQYAFFGCENLRTADFPMVERIRPYAFSHCTKLKYITAPNTYRIYEGAFSYVGKEDTYWGVQEIYMPVAQYIDNYAFKYCEELIKAIFLDVREIGIDAFYSAFWLETLVIGTSAFVCTLANENALHNTQIGTLYNPTGYIYVPRALMEQYKVAPNWAKYATRFRAIEDYPDVVNPPTN